MRVLADPKRILEHRLLARVRRYEAVVLLAFGSVCVGLFAFVQLLHETSEGETRHFDEAILLALRQSGDPALPIGPSWMTYALRDITSLGGTTVLTLVTTLVILFLLFTKRHATALFVLASIIGGWLISSGLKLGVARPRPSVVSHLVEVHDMSFPSGHAMLSAVTYLTLAALLTRTQQSLAIRIYLMAAAAFLTLLIGLSRLMLGVHFPTDVLGGWCAGAAWASFCWLVARSFLRREKVSVLKNGEASSVEEDRGETSP